MKISECKLYKVLPKKGTPVKTVKNREELPTAKTLHPFISNRINGEGIFKDFVAGSSGDWWWVEHKDGSIAIYGADEVFDL